MSKYSQKEEPVTKWPTGIDTGIVKMEIVEDEFVVTYKARKLRYPLSNFVRTLKDLLTRIDKKALKQAKEGKNK